MKIEDIQEGETYYTPNIIYLPTSVKVLGVVNGYVSTDLGDILPEQLYETEEECPQR